MGQSTANDHFQHVKYQMVFVPQKLVQLKCWSRPPKDCVLFLLSPKMFEWLELARIWSAGCTFHFCTWNFFESPWWYPGCLSLIHQLPHHSYLNLKMVDVFSWKQSTYWIILYIYTYTYDTFMNIFHCYQYFIKDQ